MGVSHLPPQSYRQQIQGSRDEQEEKVLLDTGARNPSSNYVMWVTAIWPLVLHGIFAIGIAAIVMLHVHGNHFNLVDRRPLVVLADGTAMPSTRFGLLQSDITTFISSSLASLRLITAAWLGPLCWRCAFILMENAGLRPNQLYRMIAYGFPSLPRRTRQDIGSFIWLILAIVLPTHVIAPVLTGSITWTPHNQPMGRPSNTLIHVSGGLVGGDAWWQWNNYLPRRERTCMQAAGLANIAWGRDSQNSFAVLKRTLPSVARLEVNSTIANVTLPYFSVTKIEWVKDPEGTLAPDQLSFEKACSKVLLYPGSECPLRQNISTVSLGPDEPAIWTNRSFPSPSVVSETRLMRYYASWRASLTEDCPPLVDDSSRITTTYGSADICWSFAWVTYTAGVGVCTRCRLSSYATAQNDEAITVREDDLTKEALVMMPTVVSMMILIGAGPPYRGNLDEHVIALLSRSYAASWTALTDFMGEWGSLYTSYSAALPSSQAMVNPVRVYIWLGVQLLVTISGILFLFVQARTGGSMIGDMTLAAFYLDSSNVYQSGNYDQLEKGALLKVRDGRLKVGGDELGA